MRERRQGDRFDSGEAAEFSRRLTSRLEQMTDATTGGETRQILTEFRREYTTFAHRNAHRLDVINSAYRALARRITVVGLVVTALILGLGVVSVVSSNKASDASTKASNAVTAVQNGRRLSLAATCAVESAIAEAGRRIIVGSTTPPPAAEEKALESLGFPPFKIRLDQAELAADGYVNAIASQVNAQIGGKGNGLVQRGGSINCTELERLANLAPRRPR